jgi:hypothetical protein
MNRTREQNKNKNSMIQNLSELFVRSSFDNNENNNREIILLADRNPHGSSRLHPGMAD